jgi:hypothetical protein
MSDLYDDDYYSARVDGGILRLVRKPTPYPSMESMHDANKALAAAVRDLGVRRILLDLRAGPPGRNDAEFEEASGVWRKQLAQSAERVAILLRTVAGQLQSQRLARGEGRAPDNVFLDEAEALSYLRR